MSDSSFEAPTLGIGRLLRDGSRYIVPTISMTTLGRRMKLNKSSGDPTGRTKLNYDFFLRLGFGIFIKS